MYAFPGKIASCLLLQQNFLISSEALVGSSQGKLEKYCNILAHVRLSVNELCNNQEIAKHVLYHYLCISFTHRHSTARRAISKLAFVVAVVRLLLLVDAMPSLFLPFFSPFYAEKGRFREKHFVTERISAAIVWLLYCVMLAAFITYNTQCRLAHICSLVNPLKRIYTLSYREAGR